MMTPILVAAAALASMRTPAHHASFVLPADPRRVVGMIGLPTMCDEDADCEVPMVCCDGALFDFCCERGVGQGIVAPNRTAPVPRWPRLPEPMPQPQPQPI